MLNWTRHIVVLLAFTGAVAGCQTIQFRQLSVSENDWLTDGQTTERTRVHDEISILPMEKKWEYNAAAAFGPGSPLILDGIVLAATRKGEIHSVELDSGRKRGFKGFSDGIEGSPVVDGDRLFIASAMGKRSLVAWSLRSGNALWKYKGAPFESGLVVHGGYVIGADVDGVLRAFDQESGVEVWSLSLGELVSVQSTPVLRGSRLFVASDDGVGHLVSAEDGTVIWSNVLSGPVYASPAVSNGVLYVPTTRGALDAIDWETGEVRWTVEHELNTLRFGGVAASAEHVYVGATDGVLRSLDAQTGEVVWETVFPDVLSAPPLVTANHVFIGSMGNMLYAVDRQSGQLLWQVETKGRVKSALAFVNGGIVALTEPRYITYYTPKGASDDSQD